MEPRKEQNLQRLLDQAKAEILSGKNSAFLGSLLCAQRFRWEPKIRTVCWTGKEILWNPDWFLSLSPKIRATALLHEVWHIARMYFVRMGNRDPRLWNYACDIRINNDLEYEGHPVPDNWWKDRSVDKDGIMTEEDIYDLLVQGGLSHPAPGSGTWGVPGDDEGDMEGIPVPSQALADQISQVTRAVQQAQLLGQAGTIPGATRETLNRFLFPKIPWEQELRQWMTDLIEEDYSWRRPNRRYQEIIVPSLWADQDRLAHLAFIVDTSGSITQGMVQRMHSEVRYIQETLRPQKLTLLQFDTRITSQREFTADEPFAEVEIVGGGGTWLEPVREWIETNRPTAAVIFSDLWCDPMEKLTVPTFVLWVCVNNSDAEVPFGRLIHITEEDEP